MHKGNIPRATTTGGPPVGRHSSNKVEAVCLLPRSEDVRVEGRSLHTPHSVFFTRIYTVPVSTAAQLNAGSRPFLYWDRLNRFVGAVLIRNWFFFFCRQWKAINVKKDEEGGDVARVSVIQNAYKFYVRKPDVKWPFWTDTHRAASNEEVRWQGLTGIDRLVMGSRLLWDG